MKKIYIIIFSIFFTLFFQACDKIDNPIKEGVVVWNGRKIIIYDFTGHLCINCPRAHNVVKNLTSLYGEAIVPIAIHCTSYATPRSASSPKFYYDFRTDIGDYLGGRDYEYGFYGELPLPIGLVNNLSVNNLKPDGSWPTEVAGYISSFPEFLIELNTNFSNTDSIISCNVKTITNIENSRKLSLTVFLLEDKIIQWQKDNVDVETYEHNHVLRAGFNGHFGEKIKDNNNKLSKNDNIVKSYSLRAIPKWNISNCSIVAFVYDTDNQEVLQAEIIHLNGE